MKEISKLGWTHYKLDELGSIGRGKSKHRPRNHSSLFGGKYPFIQTGEVKASELYISSYSQTYNEKGLSQSKLWKPDTLLITIAANIAETAILKISACFPDSIVGFIADPLKADVKFIKYYIDTIKIQMQNVSKGTTQDNLSLDKLLRFDILTPPIHAQNKIVGILSAYDDLIENNTRRIKILESMAQTLYQEWFVKFRFPGHEQVNMVESELGLIPEGWEIEKLRNHIKTQKGFAFKSKWYQDSGIPIVKVANFTDDSIDTKSLVCISEEIADKHQKHKLFRDEIIIQTVGSWASNPKSVVGKVIRVPIDAENSLLNQNAVKIIPLESINKTFLYSLLKKEEFKSYIIGCGQGSASQASITLDSIKEFIFLLPSAELIKSFDNFTTPLWNLINTLRAKNIALYKTRDLLLPKLISGQIDVENLDIDTGEIAA